MHNSQTLKVFFACALGAYIGDRVAFEINPALWWVGLSIGIVVGFIVGYTTYVFKRFVAAMPAALKYAYQSVIEWQPDREAWKWRVQFCICWMIFAVSTIACWWLGTSMGYDRSPSPAGVLLGLVLAFAISIGLVMGMAIPFLTLGKIPIHVARRRSLEAVTSIMRLFSLKLNPIFFFVTIIGLSQPIVISAATGVYHAAIMIGSILVTLMVVCACGIVIAGLIYLPFKHGKTIARFFKIFAKTLFLLTHSDIALLCGLDAAIGVTVGFYYHAAALGAVVGGLWGVLNFEILSIRLLKLVPQERSLFHR